MSDLSSMELYIAICKGMGLDLHAKKPELIYKYYCYNNGTVKVVDVRRDATDYALYEKFIFNQEEIDNWDYNRRVLFNKAHEEWKNRIRIHYGLNRDAFEAIYKPTCTIIAFNLCSPESQAKLCITLGILLDSITRLLLK